MSANRWNSSLKDILNLIDQDDNVLDDVVFKSIIPKVVTGDEPVQGETPAGDAEQLSRIPSELPILPLRGVGRLPPDSRAIDHWSAALDPPGG